jgi:hypothetical protein
MGKKLSKKIFLFDKTIDVYHHYQVTFYIGTVRYICTLYMSHESGEEDLEARELLRRGYSAGPVSPTCYDLKGESCYALQPSMTQKPQIRSCA